MWNEPFEAIIDPSVELIERFVQWSQEHSSLDVSSAHRTWRKAAFLVTCDHNEEALAVCKQVEDELHEHWGFLLCKAKVHRSLKEYKEAIVCLHRYKALGDRLLDVDKDYTECYYHQILLLEGAAHAQLGDYSAATACFELVIRHEFDAGSSVTFEAAVNLFTTWNAMKSHESAIDLLITWRDSKDSAKGLEYWLPGLLNYNEFHTSVVAATVQTGQHDAVRHIYDQGLQNVDADNDPYSASLWRYRRATLSFHGSTAETDHEMALDQWDEVIRASADDWTWPETMSVDMLARSLLDKAVQKGVAPMSEASSTLASRLEELVNMDLPMVRDRRQGNDDIRLPLARLYVLGDNQLHAREVLKDRMSDIFSDWPEVADAEALSLRYDKLAHTLTVLDDDVNALAAWRLWEPKQPSSEDAEDKAEDATLGAAQEGSESLAKEGIKETNGQGDADVGLHEPSPPDERHPFADIPTEKLESLRTFHCDGCNTTWNIAGDQWVCKHCLDKQLCSSCHEKLLRGDLSQTICSKDHQFLHVPPFDRPAWEKMPPDMMLVGDKLISRLAWIDELRAEWGLQQEVIDQRRMTVKNQFQAATAIARLRKSTLKKRAEK